MFFSENTEISSVPDATYPLARDTTIAITCKYLKTGIKGTIKWMHKGQVFTSGIVDAADEGGLGVSKYEIAALAESHNGEYTCSADYGTVLSSDPPIKPVSYTHLTLPTIYSV